MRDKLKRIGNYLIYILMGNALYGVVLYFVVTGLATISPLLAFLGNLALILTVILIDEYVVRKGLRPERIIRDLQKLRTAKEVEMNLRFIRWAFAHYISFKSFLFVFYIAALILSQVLRYYPTVMAESFANFIHIIDLSVIVLLAFKDFGEEFSKDKNRLKTRQEELDRHLLDHPELLQKS